MIIWLLFAILMTIIPIPFTLPIFLFVITPIWAFLAMLRAAPSPLSNKQSAYDRSEKSNDRVYIDRS